jgi:iduronate 2-sulfatase
MTGRRPDATKCWSFLDHFREEGVGDSWVAMPEWFRVNGYGTTGCGKLFVSFNFS